MGRYKFSSKVNSNGFISPKNGFFTKSDIRSNSIDMDGFDIEGLGRSSSSVDIEAGDEGSEYESDDGGIYQPQTLGHYQLKPFNTLTDVVHNHIIYIKLIPGSPSFNYALLNRYKEVVVGEILYAQIDLEKIINNKVCRYGIRYLFLYIEQIIKITIANGHTRLGDYASGEYSSARLFHAINKTDANGNYARKIVLDPRFTELTDDIAYDCNAKRGFFDLTYSRAGLFESKLLEQTYRLVLPEVAGVHYTNIRFVEPNEQLRLFISTVRAFKQLHSLKLNNRFPPRFSHLDNETTNPSVQECSSVGLAYIDLKEDNIFYVAPSENTGDIGVTYLIDGGLASPIGEAIRCTNVYKCSSKDDLVFNRQRYNWIAPECWYINEPPIASASMDVYSLGQLMKQCLINPVPEIKELIERCLAEDPNSRILLNELDERLSDYLDSDVLSEITDSTCHIFSLTL